ncbi:beta-hydroxyacid dehydrogenase, 3-hydroxyisobutyrate dehydrogenase [Rivularia sp. PCC 7116]|uniref:NAD(P)-dependent oxidoreductase n=1 Tax=Rivularia sp. PCC 7116 TaxID=373994 RepID=UPI00029F1649|nr:NAD(P)-dependent oxidoreductase [Rivularia sp. PCC 7116]AFY57944.1 beta-hydroxyacid dehydrogenase, 3-hydroxyisobutyrate dehydrogenase [Rivularia sp. PCC 7116]
MQQIYCIHRQIKLSNMNKQKVTVLGLGAMGSRMGVNLLKAGYSVTVWNRSPKPTEALAAKGAVVATTPKLAVKEADVVISMVTDSDASRAVWLDSETGALSAMRQSAIAIESSTLTVSWVKELATEFKHSGIAFLDAPVVGTRPQADSGNLIYLIGGEIETLKQAENIFLSAGGGKINHAGEIGKGMAMKLAVNAMFGIQVAAISEIIGMLIKNGFGLEKAVQYLAELPVTSPAAKNAANLILKGNHAAMFPIDLVEKDFRYVMQTAKDVEAASPISEAIHRVYLDAVDKGYGGDNITGVAKLFV